MREPEKEPTSEDVDLEKETLEEATLEETRAKDEQEFNAILRRLVRITGQISFFGPILWLFVFFLILGAATPSAVAGFLALVLFLLFIAFPISGIVGLFSCLLLWGAPTTEADLKTEIVFSALADVFALGFSAALPFVLNPFP